MSLEKKVRLSFGHSAVVTMADVENLRQTATPPLQCGPSTRRKHGDGLDFMTTIRIVRPTCILHITLITLVRKIWTLFPTGKATLFATTR